MLQWSRACSRIVPSSFMVTASPKVSFLDEVWAYLYPFLSYFIFICALSFYFFPPLDCRLMFRPSSSALHHEVSDVLDFFAQPSLHILAVIKPHCLVCKDPAAAARLPLMQRIPLLPHVSFTTLVMHTHTAFFFFLNLWCYWSASLNIVVVVPVWKLWLSALSHVCLHGKKKLSIKKVIWLKITFNISSKNDISCCEKQD